MAARSPLSGAGCLKLGIEGVDLLLEGLLQNVALELEGGRHEVVVGREGLGCEVHGRDALKALQPRLLRHRRQLLGYILRSLHTCAGPCSGAPTDKSLKSYQAFLYRMGFFKGLQAEMSVQASLAIHLLKSINDQINSGSSQFTDKLRGRNRH